MSFPIATHALLESTFRDVDAVAAIQIMRVIESTDRETLLDWSSAAQARDRECHTAPGLMDLQAHALNSLLGCHGVREINPSDEPHKHADYDYLDPGDLDAVTLVRDNSRGTNGVWLVTSVADIREQTSEATIPTDCAELIRRFEMTLDAANGRPQDCYRGHILDGDERPDMQTATTFVHRAEWTNSRHREIHVSESEHAVFTFCEGDIALQICPTRAGFDALLRSCARLYER